MCVTSFIIFVDLSTCTLRCLFKVGKICRRTISLSLEKYIWNRNAVCNIISCRFLFVKVSPPRRLAKEDNAVKLKPSLILFFHMLYWNKCSGCCCVWFTSLIGWRKSWLEKIPYLQYSDFRTSPVQPFAGTFPFSLSLYQTLSYVRISSVLCEDKLNCV